MRRPILSYLEQMRKMTISRRVRSDWQLKSSKPINSNANSSNNRRPSKCKSNSSSNRILEETSCRSQINHSPTMTRWCMGRSLSRETKREVSKDRASSLCQIQRCKAICRTDLDRKTCQWPALKVQISSRMATPSSRRETWKCSRTLTEGCKVGLRIRPTRWTKAEICQTITKVMSTRTCIWTSICTKACKTTEIRDRVSNSSSSWAKTSPKPTRTRTARLIRIKTRPSRTSRNLANSTTTTMVEMGISPCSN